MFDQVFDMTLREKTPDKIMNEYRGWKKLGLHLIATSGFLDSTLATRTFWTYSDYWPGSMHPNAGPKIGQILTFDNDRTYSARLYRRKKGAGNPSPSIPIYRFGWGIELRADDNRSEPGTHNFYYRRENPPEWKQNIPLMVRAMVLARENLFIAGPPETIPEDNPYAALEGRKGFELWVVAADTGEQLAKYKLESLPIFAGMAAAYGRLYISTADGKLICLQSAEASEDAKKQE